MKKYIIFTLISLVFLGCSQRSAVLNLAPYQSTSNSLGFNRQVQINGITDERANKSIVATITSSSGDVSEYVTLQNDIAEWVRDGLRSELTRLGAEVVGFSSDVIVDVRITSLKANLSGYATDNLKGEARLTLTIKRGDTTITKNVGQSQSKFAPIHTSGAFKSFMSELLNDVIKSAALQILKS